MAYCMGCAFDSRYVFFWSVLSLSTNHRPTAAVIRPHAVQNLMVTWYTFSLSRLVVIDFTAILQLNLT